MEISIYHNHSDYTKKMIAHWLKRYPHLEKKILEIAQSIENMMGMGIFDEKLIDIFKNGKKNREMIFLLNSLREEYIDYFSPVIISDKLLMCLKNICEGHHVLEIGDYHFLSYLLMQSNINIQHTQIKKYKKNKTNILLNDQIFSKKLIKETSIFLLSWPMYQSPEAHEYLNEMKKGDLLIYMGELEGGGCADDCFFKGLVEKFVIQESITKEIAPHYIKWGAVNDYIKVYKKILD